MSEIPGSQFSVNLQTAGLKASDKKAEHLVGSGLGKINITGVAQPAKYLPQQQSGSTGGTSRHMLLRERMAKVLPDEAVEQILKNPKPSQIHNGGRVSEASKASTKPAIPPKRNLKPKTRNQTSSKPPVPPKPDLKSKAGAGHQKPEIMPQSSKTLAVSAGDSKDQIQNVQLQGNEKRDDMESLSKASQAEPLTGQTEGVGGSVEESRDIPPLVPSGRANIEASPLPDTVREIVKNGLEAKDEKSLHKAFMQYTTKVMDYVKEQYKGSSPPPELQEAFFNGMIELGAHGDYLKSSSFTVSGVTLFKPRNKKKLALLASTILQIQQAGAAKDEAMVGSITSTVTRKGLIPKAQHELLFQTCMGLEPVSGIALRADLKSTFREIDKLEAKLANPETGDAERRGLDAELNKKHSAVASLRDKIETHDQVMKEGDRRSLDDVWDRSYAVLEQRLTTRLHKDLQTYHDLPLLPTSRKAFLNSDKIMQAAESELKKDAEGTARGKKKLLDKEGNTIESLTSIILAKRKAGIKRILEKAIKAYKPKS
ncbi:hypothetical protein [Endozoicomonas lisbonensis]|uniref:Uncharacterized protein n=1 Tax=Endozoicomonas lisbonensis TaxID=3120522 RepID=A0ABV2SD91_9GAMM